MYVQPVSMVLPRAAAHKRVPAGTLAVQARRLRVAGASSTGVPAKENAKTPDD